MGCGFVAIVPARRSRRGGRAARTPATRARRASAVTADAGRVALPTLGLARRRDGLAPRVGQPRPEARA